MPSRAAHEQVTCASFIAPVLDPSEADAPPKQPISDDWEQHPDGMATVLCEAGLRQVVKDTMHLGSKLLLMRYAAKVEAYLWNLV